MTTPQETVGPANQEMYILTPALFVLRFCLIWLSTGAGALSELEAQPLHPRPGKTPRAVENK